MALFVTPGLPLSAQKRSALRGVEEKVQPGSSLL